MKTLSRSKLYAILICCFSLFWTGCDGNLGGGGPSEEIVKKKVTEGVKGGMNAFCSNPEVLSVEISERFDSAEREVFTSSGVATITVYPIDVRTAIQCSGESILSNEEKKVRTSGFIFWRNSRDEWVVRDASS